MIENIKAIDLYCKLQVYSVDDSSKIEVPTNI